MMRLSGTIPAALLSSEQSFTELDVVALDGNRISGSIPDEWKSLKWTKLARFVSVLSSLSADLLYGGAVPR